jgi:hypothetical protein
LSSFLPWVKPIVSADQRHIIIPTASRVALTPVNFPSAARMAISVSS